MSNQTIDVGDVADIPVTFRKRNAATGAYELVDPNTVVLKTLAPGAVSPTTYTYGVDTNVTRQSLGAFLASVPITIAGVWRYQWLVGGVAVGSEFGEFVVRTPGF